ncbi:MAG: carbohydrate-binding family 9-like protein [Flavobacteriaceae bacterium]|nr:carbohydrate-binding family 9-like protein [Flavobacteriaceae bacterium]
MKTYKVHQIDTLSTSFVDDHLWEQAPKMTDFCSPWNEAPVDEITFKALWSDEYLFLKFHVEDSQVHLNTSESNRCTETIGESDRVELFFRTNDQLNPYYCLEIDPSVRVMDFKATPEKNFDFDWQWPSGELQVKSLINSTYFTVEIRLSLKSLKDLNLLKNTVIETGIYRAKYNKQADGSFEPTWISWVNPQTATPNFHIASSYGKLEFVK